MRVIAEYDDKVHPPLLKLFVHDAPHRRMHLATIQKYRQVINAACEEIGMKLPLTHDIDLKVWFFNPSSPDLGNVYLALERAMDTKTLKGSGVLADDSQISSAWMSKMFT